MLMLEIEKQCFLPGFGSNFIMRSLEKIVENMWVFKNFLYKFSKEEIFCFILKHMTFTSKNSKYM